MGHKLIEFLANVIPGGWGWFIVGGIIIVGSTAAFIYYAREPRQRSAMLYSLGQFALALGLGLLAILIGVYRR